MLGLGQIGGWNVALSDKLEKAKQEHNLSTEMSTSEQINYRVRMSEIEHQNELIAQRIDQLAESIEKNNKLVSEQILSVSKMNRKNNENLNNKVEQLKEVDQALRDNLRETLNHYFQQMNKRV
jgi:glycerol-3-phosphate dehydrogenase